MAQQSDRPNFERYLVRLPSGEEVELWLGPGGRGSVCPVCGYFHAGEPAYNYGEFRDGVRTEHADANSGFATPSFDICPSCGTQYGVDDSTGLFPERSQCDLWAELRARWLNETKWSPASLKQLLNLEIDAAQARKTAERFQTYS